MEIVGLIPAAGKGSRLGLPYPKELYPIIFSDGYKPVSQFALEGMVASGVKHIVFVVNETKSQLMGYFGDGHRFGCDLSYVVQEESLGLAQALDSAYHLVKEKTVLFGMADTIIDPKTFLSNFKDTTLILFGTDTPELYGMVELYGDRIVRIVDKPKETNLSWMWGYMIYKPEFVEFLHGYVLSGEMDFANIINLAIESGITIKGHKIEGGKYFDMGTFSGILKANP